MNHFGSSAAHYTWQCRPFQQLTATDLYMILALRQQVFVVEQHCHYLDCDQRDLQSYHLTVHIPQQPIPVAYARLLPPRVAYPNEASIGRVATALSHRRTGLGRLLMQQAIAHCTQLFGANTPIRISAQSYLERFYADFGFVPTGKQYLEDDIPHTEMRLTPTTPSGVGSPP